MNVNDLLSKTSHLDKNFGLSEAQSLVHLLHVTEFIVIATMIILAAVFFKYRYVQFLSVLLTGAIGLIVVLCISSSVPDHLTTYKYLNAYTLTEGTVKEYRLTNQKTKKSEYVYKVYINETGSDGLITQRFSHKIISRSQVTPNDNMYSKSQRNE